MLFTEITPCSLRTVRSKLIHMTPLFILTQTPNMEFSLSHIDEKKILAALHFTGLFDVFMFPVPFLSLHFFGRSEYVCVCVCVCLGLCVCVCVCA